MSIPAGNEAFIVFSPLGKSVVLVLLEALAEGTDSVGSELVPTCRHPDVNIVPALFADRKVRLDWNWFRLKARAACARLAKHSESVTQRALAAIDSAHCCSADMMEFGSQGRGCLLGGRHFQPRIHRP
jgi:hypothetical protein